MALFLFGVFALLLVIGVPIAIALGMAAFASIWTFTTVDMSIAPQVMFKAVNSFPMMAIPFFILAGNVMSSGGISERLVKFASSLVGSLTGGLAHITVLASMFFAAISGSSPATTAAIGSVMVPAMTERGYDKNFATAVAAAAGTVGVVIPPSIPMVLYAVLAGVSIGRLFLAGLGPGILMGLSMMAVVYFISKREGYVGTGKFSFRDLYDHTAGGALPLCGLQYFQHYPGCHYQVRFTTAAGANCLYPPDFLYTRHCHVPAQSVNALI